MASSDETEPPSDVVWMVEDDVNQADNLRLLLIGHHSRIKEADVKHIATESAFLKRLKDAFTLKEEPRPRLIIADMMLPWSYPEGPESLEIKRPRKSGSESSFWTAGARCWVALRQEEKRLGLRVTPFVFHTVIRPEEFDYEKSYRDAHTAYIAKDEPADELKKAVQTVTDLDEPWDESPDAVTQQLLANPKMRKILLLGLKTPLQQCDPFPI